MPQWYLDEPEISRSDVFYLSAFWDLSIGEPIPWRDRIAYAEKKGLEPDMVEAFNQIIRELDNEFQKHRAAQIKKDQKQNGRI